MSDDWLYGGSPGGRQDRDPDRGPARDPGSDNGDADATRPVARQPKPDETRVMPTLSRDPRARTDTPGTPAARSPRETPPPPRERPPGMSGGVRRWFGGARRRFKLRYLWLLLVLWLVYLIAVPFFAWNNVSQVNAFPAGQRPADTPGTNYLIVGSDSRKGLTAEQRKELHTGNDAGQRTDTTVSSAIPHVTRLAATADAEPADDIPGSRSVSYGLQNVPPKELRAPSTAYSARLALARMIAPASRNRFTNVASSGGRSLA